jgi:hypothetical protein
LAASSKGVHERRAQGSAQVQVAFDVEQSESCDDLLEAQSESEILSMTLARIGPSDDAKILTFPAEKNSAKV